MKRALKHPDMGRFNPEYSIILKNFLIKIFKSSDFCKNKQAKYAIDDFFCPQNLRRFFSGNWKKGTGS